MNAKNVDQIVAIVCLVYLNPRYAYIKNLKLSCCSSYMNASSKSLLEANCSSDDDKDGENLLLAVGNAII